jgi:carboxymethylenebutenolidase
VHEHICLAKLGYPAIAPELFVRQGDDQSCGEVGKVIGEVVAKVPDAQVLGDLDACVAWASANGGDPARLGITGFCRGGRSTWLCIAHNAAVRAGVAWYGQMLDDSSALKPTHPIDVVGQLTPVLGLYGERDTGIALSAVDAMKAALAALTNPAAKQSGFVVPA